MKIKTCFFIFLIFQCFDKNWVFNIGFISIQYKNTNQYYVKFNRKIRGKITDFFEMIFFRNLFFEWARPGPKRNSVGISPIKMHTISHWVGLSPIVWTGLMI